jgi:acetoin utilization deacetylase AcuC-like enzyme
MGFCFYNNVVVAALSLLQQGLERILIFDWVRPAAL